MHLTSAFNLCSECCHVVSPLEDEGNIFFASAELSYGAPSWGRVMGRGHFLALYIVFIPPPPPPFCLGEQVGG